VPIHMQEAAQFLGYRKGDLPVTEKVSGEVLSLPMYAELTDSQIDRVVANVTEFMRTKA
jgi:dTDP-4-amino-4,6-dideoxygalactose transaminase